MLRAGPRGVRVQNPTREMIASGKRTSDAASVTDADCLSKSHRATIVLVDMDGVLANFDQRVFDVLSERHPEVEQPAKDERLFPLKNSFATEHHALLHAIMTEPGFFASLAPIEGAVDSMHAMLAHGLDVRICSAPLASSPACAAEKVAWVAEHLGKEWVDRLILTRDKTYVRGDYLIDDAPVAKGSGLEPTWEHIYMEQPYNRPGKPKADPQRRRLTRWTSWREVIPQTTSAEAL